MEIDAKVHYKFSGLILHAYKKVEEQVSPDTFRATALVVCPLVRIEEASSVCKMFEALTSQRRWSCQHYHHLRRFLRELGITDDETNKRISDYTQSLHCYNVTIKIVDWINMKKLDKKQLDHT